MEFAGSLRQYSIVDLVRSLEDNQRTGRMSLSSGGLRAMIYVAGGQWLLAERSGPGQLLAQQFVKAGLVTPEQIEAACSVSFAKAGAIPDVQLVRALLTTRTLSQEQLRAWAINDAVALLSVVLGWVDGEFVFEDNIGAPPGRIALPLPIGQVLTLALQRVQATGLPAREVTPVTPEAIVNFVEVGPESDAAIQITRDQWRLLTAVDGLASLRAIAQGLQAPEPLILHLAGELVSAGLIMVVGREGAGG
jgi:hypothetical protein